MLCRITDDPSYDYSDYCEGKGAYAPYEEDYRTEPEDDPENWEDAHLYPPISPEEAQERIAEVKAQWAEVLRVEKQLRKQFGGDK
jgi:hypothetical protein